jgi:hypothetical protein
MWVWVWKFGVFGVEFLDLRDIIIMYEALDFLDLFFGVYFMFRIS